MRTEDMTSFEIVTFALADAHHMGKHGDRPGQRFHAKNAAFEFVDKLDKAGFTIVSNGGSIELVPETAKSRVVVLDEAEERKLQDLLSGKSVPTGRIVEVTYRMPDGSTRTQRHAEFGSIDKVSYNPPPVVGSEIAGATVLKATETVRKLAAGDYSDMCDRTFRNLVRQMGFIHGAIVHADGSITPLDKEAMDAGVVAVGERPLEPGSLKEVPVGFKLEPGRTAGFPSGLRDDVGILGVFYSDGIISFAGDCNDMVAFRDMAAKVVGVPGSRAS